MQLDHVGDVTIERVVVGPIETNCYILVHNGSCIVIDPGDDLPVILEAVGGRDVAAIVLTHRHIDHITALAGLAKATGAKVYAHELDAGAIEDPTTDFVHGAPPVPVPEGTRVDVRLAEGDVVEAAGVSLEVLHTPGHTIGGICLLMRDESGAPAVLFSGDTLFAGAIGRTDLNTGDYAQIVRSISEKICPLPDDVRVYPGHDSATTMARERKYNPYVRS